MNTSANTRQHKDGPTWAVVSNISRELAHIAENGGYIFLADDMQLWEAQHGNEYDHVRYDGRLCS